jgi:hypothetical protein
MNNSPIPSITPITPLLGGLVWADHQLRPHILIKVLTAQRFQLHRALLQRQALVVRVLRHLRSHVVADNRVQASYQHETGESVSIIDV